jgi:hypothetical protein
MHYTRLATLTVYPDYFIYISINITLFCSQQTACGKYFSYSIKDFIVHLLSVMFQQLLIADSFERPRIHKFIRTEWQPVFQRFVRPYKTFRQRSHATHRLHLVRLRHRFSTVVGSRKSL